MTDNYQKSLMKEAKSKRRENRLRVLTGDNIRRIRKEKGLKLTDLSKLSGVQIAILSRMENNLQPGTIEAHAQIAEVLEIELYELFKDVKIIRLKNNE